jgi:glycosyltransferase involved in cell wall biosynthesis
MRFTIVTPSYNNSRWLPLCIASVADQEGVSFEHIVQDACSNDGTQEWLPKDTRVTAVIEKDKGMYDAINRGWKRGKGDLVAWLNCDEQYLPGALKAVSDYADRHPEVDLIIGHTVVADGDGNYVCHRRSLLPRLPHLWVKFPILSCSVFLRRAALEKNGFYFDTQWRDLGDVHWMMDMVRRGVRAGLVQRYLSVFSETGENMNLKPNARREKEVTNGMMPGHVRRLQPVYVAWHRMRMLMSGNFTQKPFEFSLYTFNSPQARVTRFVAKPTPIWRMPDGRVRQ